jgi:putative aminopeptidase FrvX
VLGKGPVSAVRDAHSITDPAVLAWITETAAAQGIPCRQSIDPGRSGARQVQQSRQGVRVGALSIACRYAGGGVEMVDMLDIENAVRLGLALALASGRLPPAENEQ